MRRTYKRWLSRSQYRHLERRSAGGPASSHQVPPALSEPLEARRILSGSWTALTNQAPEAIGTMLLLSDGTVMAQGGGSTVASANWYKLSPDLLGDYESGTWSQLASMHTPRRFFASNMLTDGRVFVLGGEYSGQPENQNWTNTGEIFNPLSNTWSDIQTFPMPRFGDVPTSLLPDGSILCGSLTDGSTYIYDPVHDVWTVGQAKLPVGNRDQSDEETWVKLPDGSILSYNIWADVQSAQRYDPIQRVWLDAGTVPVALHTPKPHWELGPALLLPNQQVFFMGATQYNALYDPASNSWTATASTPPGLGANDAPAAMMPNGKVLYAAGSTPDWGSGTFLYEYDYANPSVVSNVPPGGGLTLGSTVVWQTRMLVLPTGQVLFSNGLNQLFLYTPDGTPAQSWRPTINRVIEDGTGKYVLEGTQLNGISEGACYGDDAEMSSNYPIVRIVDSGGSVEYARTYGWSSTGVATGSTIVSTCFTLPAGIAPGAFTLSVIANGISSGTVIINRSAELAGSSGSMTYSPTVSGYTLTSNGYGVTTAADPDSLEFAYQNVGADQGFDLATQITFTGGMSPAAGLRRQYRHQWGRRLVMRSIRELVPSDVVPLAQGPTWL